MNVLTQLFLSGGKFHAQCDDLKNSEWLEERGVNIPISVIL